MFTLGEVLQVYGLMVFPRLRTRSISGSLQPLLKIYSLRMKSSLHVCHVTRQPISLFAEREREREQWQQSRPFPVCARSTPAVHMMHGMDLEGREDACEIIALYFNLLENMSPNQTT